MAELPDLIVMAENLDKLFSGKKIKRLKILTNKKLNATEKEFREAIENSKVRSIHPDGKTLQFEFANGHVLGLHLMLKGFLTIKSFGVKTREPNIIDIEFENKDRVGVFDFLKQARPTLDPDASSVPGALDKTLTLAKFKKLLLSRDQHVKEFLMDQHLIRGIGNAYSDEMLYEAQLSPFSITTKLPEKEIAVLYKTMKKSLKDGVKQIKKINPDQITGEIRSFMKVHRPKQKTTADGDVIKIGTLNGRKTYYTDAQKEYK
jgi:formamidopyrimidine-DNA glycosylase